jgi:hypothetical protein
MTMFPYDVNELADGPIRCMFAPIDADLPAGLDDIFDQVDPYDKTTDWEEFGATAGPSTGVDTVASGSGKGATKKVPVGNIEDLTQYRMAFVGRRGKDQGIVTEPAPGAKVRGRMFAFVAYRAQLTADNLQLGFAEGDLANANVTFKLFPEPGQASGEEHGFWIFEDAGTFAA